jgi:hypothetical protein
MYCAEKQIKQEKNGERQGVKSLKNMKREVAQISCIMKWAAD